MSTAVILHLAKLLTHRLLVQSVRIPQEIEDRWGRETAVVEIDKEKLGMIVRLIRYYEIKEATTSFELALWKSKISQAEGDFAGRGVCRVEVPGPVKDTIKVLSKCLGRSRILFYNIYDEGMRVKIVIVVTVAADLN